MKIRVNGDEMEVESGASVRSLIEQLGLDGGPVAVERNGQVVPRVEHAEVRLEQGDVLEIVHFVGGG